MYLYILSVVREEIEWNNVPLTYPVAIYEQVVYKSDKLINVQLQSRSKKCTYISVT